MRVVGTLVCLATLACALGCGARTGLFEGEDEPDGWWSDLGADLADVLPDARPDAGSETAPDARPEVVPDAIPEVLPDTTPPPDTPPPDAVPPPDVAPDVAPPPDAVPPPDAPPDVLPPPDGRPDGRPDGWPDGRPEIAPEVGPDGGGCDPTMCSLSCQLSGSDYGVCVGDVCVCRGSDGGTTDGGTPDGMPPRPDGGRDFVREGRDGMRDGRRDFSGESGVEAAAGSGAACDDATCAVDCLAAGYVAGFCDPSGNCVCV